MFGRVPKKTKGEHVVLALFQRDDGAYDVLAYVCDMGLIWGRGFNLRKRMWTGADYFRSVDEIRAMASRDTLVWRNPVAISNVAAIDPDLTIRDLDWCLRAPEHA